MSGQSREEGAGSGVREGKPDYGNWVSRRLIVVNAAAALVLLGLSRIAVAFAAGAVFFLLASAYFAYTRWRFSPRGGNLQGRIRQHVLDRAAWDGRGSALDVGCGNGPLVIALAKRFPAARVTGVDFWGRPLGVLPRRMREQRGS